MAHNSDNAKQTNIEQENKENEEKMAFIEKTEKIKELSQSEIKEQDENNTESSNLTQSWVFIEAKSDDPDLKASNEFYLNCLEEPVQELYEHDLGSHHSDIESDSDGISVISESDPTDKTDEEQPLDENEMEIEEDEVPDHFSIPARNVNIEYPVQIPYLVAFSIVLMMVPLHWYFSPSNYHRTESPEVTVQMEPETSEAKIMPDLTETDMLNNPEYYCSQLYEALDYISKENDIKKCIRRIEKAREKISKINQKLQNKILNVQDDNKIDDIEEIHLDYKSEYIKRDNNENKHEIYSKKIKYRKHYDGYKKEHKNNKYNNENFDKQFDMEEGNVHAVKENINGNELTELEQKLKAREEYLAQRELYLEKKEFELKQLEMKNNFKNKIQCKDGNKENENPNKQSDNSEVNRAVDWSVRKRGSEYKKQDTEDSKDNFQAKIASNMNNDPYYQKNKYPENKKPRVYDKSKYVKGDFGDEENENSGMFSKGNRIKQKKQDKGNDYYNKMSDINSEKCRGKNSEKCKYRNKRYKNRNENQKNGHWYSNLFEGRSKIRKIDTKSDWLFDRARERSVMRKVNIFGSSY